MPGRCTASTPPSSPTLGSSPTKASSPLLPSFLLPSRPASRAAQCCRCAALDMWRRRECVAPAGCAIVFREATAETFAARYRSSSACALPICPSVDLLAWLSRFRSPTADPRLGPHDQRIPQLRHDRPLDRAFSGACNRHNRGRCQPSRGSARRQGHEAGWTAMSEARAFCVATIGAAPRDHRSLRRLCDTEWVAASRAQRLPAA